ncbi:Crp/Fnr family transcriptional regulator [Tissierella carlieri]|uniref:Crp/Fnr family transcriptional regulator n=1 Tax=Tissierella carlieri TaxID=689904 RepID=A0ABT1SBS3_9FIRM|nr:Crp/Fnr family transcriptional regulator [Tissierella carlieri]MBU5313224.1 Crp/Fnr family transcriptional regulator [Tissierella carlieri]MCQ4923920.1 Crp/Fnr family transcriptional regulator [Tissierella carlieri]MDU5082569.1 Crp/Fnr family transcriptional regulator [Bacillota bacterium]
MNIYNSYSINYDYKNILLKHFKDIGTIIDFQKDTLIEFEFKKLDYIYLILDGIVKQFFLDLEGAERIILLLSTGDMFGEITMLQQDSDRVITKTYSRVKVCKIEKSVFYNYLKKNPFVYDSILLMITTKFRILMTQIYDNTYLNTKERLFFLLKRLSIQQNSLEELGHKLNFNLTHEELANMIGSTRSTVTRIMKLLESEGKIARNGRKINIIDL